MRDEGLRAPENPGKIAAAQFPSSSEREEDAQPSRVCKSASPLDHLGEHRRIRQVVAHMLGETKVDAEKLAGVVSGHPAILTFA